MIGQETSAKMLLKFIREVLPPLDPAVHIEAPLNVLRKYSTPVSTPPPGRPPFYPILDSKRF